jgi:Fe-Mn family superoxide dismutase
MSKEIKLPDNINEMISNSVTEALKKQFPKLAAQTTEKPKVKNESKPIQEAVITIQKDFTLKTETLSGVTKENHIKLYQNYSKDFNAISVKLDSITRNKPEPINPNNSEFKRLKEDEVHNLNGLKLHEFYFNNISAPNSKVTVDSLPYMRLVRDFGSFDNWQFEFRNCALAATEGWAMTYYDPYKNKYFNCSIEKHNLNIPIMSIPIIVLDTWHHAWFLDYPNDKLNYINKTMQELNWSIIEARMMLSEKADLSAMYAIRPIINSEPERMIGASKPINEPPIPRDQIAGGRVDNNISPGPLQQFPSKSEMNPSGNIT